MLYERASMRIWIREGGSLRKVKRVGHPGSAPEYCTVPFVCTGLLTFEAAAIIDLMVDLKSSVVFAAKDDHFRKRTAQIYHRPRTGIT